MAAANGNVFAVALAALATALATGLGALPFLVVRRPARALRGVASAAAGGFMVAAAVMLVWEGLDESGRRTALGFAAGVAVMVGLQRALAKHEHEAHVGALRAADALKAITIVAVMTAHSFAEGVGVGVAYGGGETLGVFITLAIAVHNIPEGLAISLVLVPRGSGIPAAAGWSVVSSLPQPLMAVPAFLFVEAFSAALPVGLGFAAGAMAWMVVAELVPDARADAARGTVALSFVVAFTAMIAVQLLLAEV
ncbi:MAG: ZIP family metal transporter [Thermoleophilia bacterium]|nr:ZIP family metal transporter [Thermoleophilia bacterium]